MLSYVEALEIITREMRETYERNYSKPKAGEFHHGRTMIPATEFNAHRRDLESIVQEMRGQVTRTQREHGVCPDCSHFTDNCTCER